jgi:hypothetical protein
MTTPTIGVIGAGRDIELETLTWTRPTLNDELWLRHMTTTCDPSGRPDLVGRLGPGHLHR